MTRKILAPHKEQDGYVYLRARKADVGYDATAAWNPPTIMLKRWFYGDTYPDQRVISSRRVEEAVEIYDYLKRCDDEGLVVLRHKDSYEWGVSATNKAALATGKTLREAYHRYKAQS